MIDIKKDNVRFFYRAVGVAINEGRFLLYRAEGENAWLFPGGRVELLESAAASVCREIAEELEIAVEVERLLWVVEQFFEVDGIFSHELGFYFMLKLPANFAYLNSTEPFYGDEEGLKLIFRWFTPDELDEVLMYPLILKEALRNIPAVTQYIVFRQESGQAEYF